MEEKEKLAPDNPQENLNQELNLPKETTKKTGSKGCLIGSIAIFSAIIGAVIGAVIAALLVPMIFGVSPLDIIRGESFEDLIQRKTVTRRIKKATGDSTTSAVIAVSEKVRPSVVNVRTRKLGTDPFHADLPMSESEGSGVIFREDGYVVTNNHVVENADEIWLSLVGDKDVKGEVVGRDAEVDIALIKVDKKNLPAAELGSSSDLIVGELAVAIGSPFSFEDSVTSGIISGLNRTLPVKDRTYTGLIQTDAAINPGNSGGALCNEEGKVIGINTVIASTSGGHQGIGFAVPIDVVESVAKQLMKTGKASHPFVGVMLADVTESVKKQHDLSVDKGAIIAEVSKDTPADKAGLKPKDVIIAFDGKSIEDANQLIALIRQKKVGDKVKLTYVRGKERKTVVLVLAEKPQKYLK